MIYSDVSDSCVARSAGRCRFRAEFIVDEDPGQNRKRLHQ